MRATVIWRNSLANLSQKANFLWAVNPNNAKTEYLLYKSWNWAVRNDPKHAWLAPIKKKFLAVFVTLLFVFFITFGSITIRDVVLPCVFLLWTCFNIKELNQYYLNKTRKRDRITELSIISINWPETLWQVESSILITSFLLDSPDVLCQTNRNRSVKYWKRHRV